MKHDRSLQNIFVSRAQSLYLGGAAGMLLFSGLAKALSTLENLPALDQRDRIFFFLTTRQLMLLASCVELVIAAVIVPPLKRWNETKPVLLAWLASAFLTYRAGLVLAGEPPPCHCLGNILTRLGLSDEFTRAASIGMLVYLLLPSLAWIWIRGRRKAGSSGESHQMEAAR